jgi:hypothetical protein
MDQCFNGRRNGAAGLAATAVALLQGIVNFVSRERAASRTNDVSPARQRASFVTAWFISEVRFLAVAAQHSLTERDREGSGPARGINLRVRDLARRAGFCDIRCE